MLDRQFQLFRVDTNAFLTDDEQKQFDKLVQIKKTRKRILKEKKQKEISDEKLRELYKKNVDELTRDERQAIRYHKRLRKAQSEWKTFILDSSAKHVAANEENDVKDIRKLRKEFVEYIDKDGNCRVNLNNVVGMFESTLSRSLGIGVDELTYDMFILEIYYYDIAKDLIKFGFDFDGKHYVYFSSSAGQIRTKKAVFVEEQKYNECQKKLMCGLSVQAINDKGGMNVNKFLAYLALCNSATDLWEDILGLPFDIDRSIVVDDFETEIACKVDDINVDTYEIKSGVDEKISIPHTDGCGLISPELSKKNFMVRLPFVKGLLGVFDFKRFLRENNCSGDVKDIWGKTYNVFDDNIQVIFTKSQLKMYKYYDSWDQYKGYFKQYGCEAGICNLEEDRISNAKINYQMLQTLYDMTDKEVEDLCKNPNRRVKEVSDTLSNALSFFGVDLNYDNPHASYWQKALQIYPELITDPATKADLRDLKKSLIKKYKSGKLDVIGKFTFILPDLYAFCEWLFMGIEQPEGLLKNNEVFCRLYKTADKLDVLRSPHLYIEHAVRHNVYEKKTRNHWLKEWFDTDAIYTSTFDPISRILQFDVDGDRALVLAQKKIIEIAERCAQNVYPLYYPMKKANAEILTSDSIYNGLILAFRGGRIGMISNEITKIWNSENIDQDALSAVKWLCMETNFTIDYAKTLFKPIRPPEVDTKLRMYARSKVPFFFRYAKNKKKEQTEDISNSMMDRIAKSIKDDKAAIRSIRNLAKVDYLMLLKDKNDDYYNSDVADEFDLWNKKYGNNLVIDDDDHDKNNIPAICAEVLNSLHKIENDDDKIINTLIVMLYKKPSTRKKKLLWCVYGKQLYENLLHNVDTFGICKKCGKRTNEDMVNGQCADCRKREIQESSGMKVVQCIDCGTEFSVPAKNNRTCRCEECRILQRRDYLKRKKQEEREMSTYQSGQNNVDKVPQI